LIALMLFALDTPKVQGPLNLTAPEALTNRDFSKLLGKVLHRPSWLPVPKFALKLALGEVAETLVTGQRVVPDVAMRLGYQFKHPDCEEALRSLLG
jgi:NAD dependent epimerase/dehydratase family enzyme